MSQAIISASSGIQLRNTSNVQYPTSSLPPLISKRSSSQGLHLVPEENPRDWTILVALPKVTGYCGRCLVSSHLPRVRATIVQQHKCSRHCGNGGSIRSLVVLTIHGMGSCPLYFASLDPRHAPEESARDWMLRVALPEIMGYCGHRLARSHQHRAPAKAVQQRECGQHCGNGGPSRNPESQQYMEWGFSRFVLQLRIRAIL